MFWTQEVAESIRNNTLEAYSKKCTADLLDVSPFSSLTFSLDWPVSRGYQSLTQGMTGLLLCFNQCAKLVFPPVAFCINTPHRQVYHKLRLDPHKLKLTGIIALHTAKPELF